MLSYSDLQRVFSREVLISLSMQESNDLLTKASNEYELKSSAKLFAKIYHDLVENYRSDFVFRSLIAQKLFLSRHNLAKSAMLNELRIGTAKADVVVLNGSSTAYEIKSDVDNFSRLHEQLLQYLKVFDKIYVVVSHKKLASVQLPSDHIGVIVVAQNNALRVERKALSNKSNVIPDVMFETLRKDEYLRIIQREFGEAPLVPNTRIFTECKKLFCTIKPERAHDLFVKEMKLRVRYSTCLQSTLREFPEYMQYPILRAGVSDNQLRNLGKQLI